MSKLALIGGMLDSFSKKLMERFRLRGDSSLLTPEREQPKQRTFRWFESTQQAHGPIMLPLAGWESGSRQVRRHAMRIIAFQQVTKDYWNGHGMRTISRRRARQLARMRAALNYNLQAA